MDSQSLQQITLWLTKLALLTSGGRTPVTKQQIGLYALMFVEELPVNSFSDESLSRIAARYEFFPAYAVLKAALGAPPATPSNPTGRAISQMTGTW